MEHRVVITGIGLITPIGAGTETFWNNCLTGKTNVAEIPGEWKQFYTPESQIWSVLPEIDYKQYAIPDIEAMQLDSVQKLGLGAAWLALENAGLKLTLINQKKHKYTIDNLNSETSGVFMGTGMGGITSAYQMYKNHLLAFYEKQINILEDIISRKGNEQEEIAAHIGHLKAATKFSHRYNPYVIPMAMVNAIAARIGIKYALKGMNAAFSASCASGTVAIGNAFRAVKRGELEFVIAGGAEYLHEGDGMIFRGFDVTRTLAKCVDDPDKANRPFDKKRTGFLFSEGAAAALILESREHALKRNARIFAEITGYGETGDAHSIMIIDPGKESIIRMIKQALSESGLTPGDIDYINAHGTGTLLNDDLESVLIETLFGDKPLVNSTKSLLGHTIGACGAIEAGVCALSLYHQETHACKNLEDPVSTLNFSRESGSYKIRSAFTQSLGFGGHNAGLVLEQYRE